MQGRTTIHLVRHGQVDNPRAIIYGRLPGYHLSERGKRQAEAAARRLEHADVGAVWSSPMERAQETAEIIAAPHGIPVTTDERLTESLTTLEGVRGTIRGLLTAPRHWWHFRNPMRPSWGESFDEVRKRMLDAVADALSRSDGRELVIVSHQTPLLVCRLALARRKLPPWLAFPCHTGSVTSMVLDDGRLVSSTYFRPRV